MGEALSELLLELTTEEKVRLLAGHDFWHTEAVERLGLPPMHLSDGPVGVRGARSVGPTSVSFPCGTAIGATFDPDAARLLARALADECLEKRVHVLLGPTVNIQRHPLGGRHFECYSEDPVLTAELAVSYVTALQERGVAATIKHFVANDTEFERHTISSDVEEEVLEQLYLVPFEEAVRRGGVLAVMTSYNKVNGTYAAENTRLIALLRETWGFDGLVMSDWSGAQSTVASALAGLDLEMPGPPVHYGERLLEKVASKEVPADVLDERVRNVLLLAERSGALTGRRPAPETTLEERRAVSRELATRSIVCLENRRRDGSGRRLLPFDLPPGSLLAVVGPNAARTASQGGGSAQVNAERVVSILEGLTDACAKASVALEHELGCVASPDPVSLDLPVRIDYYRREAGGRASVDGDPVYSEISPRPPLLWLGDPVPGVEGLEQGRFAASCTWTISAGLDGLHEIVVSQVGTAKVYLDGTEVLEAGGSEKGRSFYHLGSVEASATVDLRAGESYELRVDYEVEEDSPLAGLSIAWRPPYLSDGELIERAAALARRADAVCCVVGTGPEFETEGHDRENMDLPGRQDELVEAVLAANEKTVVVLNTGSPVTCGWAESAGAVLQCWFGGEAVGLAVSDVLFGEREPSGRLPHTVPASLADTPAHPFYPGEDGHSRYGEGLFVGYRHYASRFVAPRWWFGHGLSYGEPAITEARADIVDGELRVLVGVYNSGERAGTVVAQGYLSPIEATPSEPALVFVGAARKELASEQQATVQIDASCDRLSRLGLLGRYRVLAGLSAEPSGLVPAGKVSLSG